jgi:hypothetical protein
MVDDDLRRQIKELEKKTGIKLPECNSHCGVNKFTPRWLRKILSARFNLSCIIHDIHHGSKIISYREADLIFLSNMKKQAGSSLYWNINAYVYYTAVSLYTVYKQKRDY